MAAGPGGGTAADSMLALSGVIGVTTSPSSLHALSPASLLYVAGNVGVIYDRTTRTQKLLRGHVRTLPPV